MNAADNLVAGQSGDDPFDLAPMAEALDVAGIAAGMGARSRFEAGVVAISLDESRRVGNGPAVADEECFHAHLLTRDPFADRAQASLAPCQPRRGVAPVCRFCHRRRMSMRSSQAGGLFLMLAILAGAAWGLTVGQPMLGILRGTGAGFVIALAVWLIDRRRARSED